MNVNLQKIANIFEDILENENPSPNQLRAIQYALNDFYRGNSQCKQILYTKNTDRAFFGMCVYPDVSKYTAIDIIQSKKIDNRKDSEYILEFDSKLFNPLLGLTSMELTAILMHEVGHIAIDESRNAEIVSDFVNEYIAKKDKTITIDDVKNCGDLFKYAYIHTVQTVNSIFNKNEEEFEADKFSVDMGLGHELESAYVKIMKARGTVCTTGKFNTLIWMLTTYNQLYKRRKFIIKCMDDLNTMSGSKLEKDANNEVKKSLLSDFKKIINEFSILDSDRLEYIKESFGGKMKYSALKAIEDDTFVYALRIKNVDNEIEACDMMRDINNKINIVSDYMRLEKNLSEEELRRWGMLVEKLRGLREQLLKSDSYKPKYYGLYVQMPVVKHY